MQPRDDIGRFAKGHEGPKGDDVSGPVILFRGRAPTRKELSSRHLSENAADLVVVDESNMFSSRTSGSRAYLTVVCTRIPSGVRNQYGSIAKQIPSRKGERAKYSSTTDPARTALVKSIAEKDIEIVESHRRIDYDRVSGSSEKKKLYLKVLSESLDKALDLDPKRETDVVIDSVPLKVNRELNDLASDLHEAGRPIRWFETRKSAADRYLTVHDFETGVVAGWIEGDERSVALFEGHIRRRFRGGDRWVRRKAHGSRGLGPALTRPRSWVVRVAAVWGRVIIRLTSRADVHSSRLRY